MSPRRNARASAPPPTRRPATRGRTRALGQHFLRDRAVVDRILDQVRPTARDLVVEIGPGRVLAGLVRKIVRGAECASVERPEEIDGAFGSAAADAGQSNS